MNPVGIDRGAGGLLAAAERASRRAQRLRAHALTDLALSDGERLSDELRATWHLLRDNAINDVERGLRDTLVNSPILQGGGADLKEALATPHSLVRDVLDHAQFPDQPDLSGALLEQASNIVLRRRLSARARRVGEVDPVRSLSGSQSKAGPWATALLLAQSISEGPEAAPVLAAEQHHALVWAVAAALRVALETNVLDVDALDRIVSDSATSLLAQHEEARAVDVIASRLARVSEGVVDPPTALIAGYPEFSAALLAEATGIDRHAISAIQHESDGARLALVFKAANTDRDAAAKALVVLAEVRLNTGDVAKMISGYDALEIDEARRALSSLRVDPRYARAVARLSGDEQ